MTAYSCYTNRLDKNRHCQIASEWPETNKRKKNDQRLTNKFSSIFLKAVFSEFGFTYALILTQDHHVTLIQPT